MEISPAEWTYKLKEKKGGKNERKEIKEKTENKEEGGSVECKKKERRR